VKDIEHVGARVKGVDVTNRFWDAVESGFDVKIEERVQVKGRGEVTLRASFHPVAFQSAVSWCICYFEAADSSPLKQSQLWEYQNYVACVATSSGDAIVGLDMDGNIKYWNQGAQALFGYSDDEIVGKPVTELVPEELQREAQLVLKVVKEQGIYKNYDTSRVHKNGRMIPVTMTVTAVRNDDGEFIGTAATLKDLRSTRDLHEKALEAEKLNAVLQMAVTVYHQVNNPLCVIAANTQLLLTRVQGSDGEEAKKLESILEATKRISTVLEDLGRLTGVEPQIAQPQDKK
jgi:PAS domain S-box-containing protein